MLPPVAHVLPNQHASVPCALLASRALLALPHAIQRLIRITIPPIAWAFSDASARSLPIPTMDTTAIIPGVGGSGCPHPNPLPKGEGMVFFTP